MKKLVVPFIALIAFLGTCIFTGQYSLASGGGLTVEKLQNAEYKLRCGKVKLTDGGGGKCESSPYCCVELPADNIVFGDLNGDGIPDAAVIFWTDTGGH